LALLNNVLKKGSLEPQAQRLFFLDWLRIAALLVLVLYHVGMYYVSWDFHVKSPFASTALEPWMKLSAPWRMDLIFVISGAAFALMLKSGANLALLKSRSRFLLLPLLLGMVLIVPPQSYFEVVQKFGFKDGYLGFLGLYFKGFKGFCQNGQCLILPTWNHLWFVPYLWLYSVVLWVIVRLKPKALVKTAEFADKVFQGSGLLVIPIVLIAMIRLILQERFPSNHAVMGDWFNHAMYLSMFLLGAVLASRPSFWPQLATWRFPALVMALTCWALWLGLGRTLGLNMSSQTVHVIIAALQWSAIVAAFGFAHKLLNIDHSLRQQLSEAVFPVYIFHQTFSIVFSQALAPMQWPALIEGPVLVVLTIAWSYFGYLAVRKVTWLRPWFGLRRLPNHIPAHP
jgi:glucans biosynthesis protein C